MDKKRGLRPESCLLSGDTAGLPGIERAVYDVAISFRLPSEPEVSRNAKSRYNSWCQTLIPS